MNQWLNFEEVKQTVPIGRVLEHYQWECLRQRRNQVSGCCPIHHGRREDAFHADLQHNGFHCFACQAHGSVLDLVAAMERCSIRQAARFLKEWFGVQPMAPSSARGVCHKPKEERIREKETGPTGPVPLRFSLRPVDSGHVYLQQRGIGADTAARFGVGYYAGPGLLQGRVVIPIHDESGQLLAYAGRSIDHAGPKYKFPAGFRKSSVLFNLHRVVAGGQDSVIVVEGFFDCLKVHQAGLSCVVALMGCSLSDHQEALLVKRFRNVALMLDADCAGQQGSRLIAGRLRQHCIVDIIHLANGRQPDQLSAAEIHRAVSVVRANRRSSKK